MACVGVTLKHFKFSKEIKEKSKSNGQKLNPQTKIEYIVTRRIVSQEDSMIVWQYLVKWVGCSDDYNTWEPGVYLKDRHFLTDLWEKQFRSNLLQNSGKTKLVKEETSQSKRKRSVSTPHPTIKNEQEKQKRRSSRSQKRNHEIPEVVCQESISKPPQEEKTKSFPKSLSKQLSVPILMDKHPVSMDAPSTSKMVDPALPPLQRKYRDLWRDNGFSTTEWPDNTQTPLSLVVSVMPDDSGTERGKELKGAPKLLKRINSEIIENTAKPKQLDRSKSVSFLQNYQSKVQLPLLPPSQPPLPSLPSLQPTPTSSVVSLADSRFSSTLPITSRFQQKHLQPFPIPETDKTETSHHMPTFASSGDISRVLNPISESPSEITPSHKKSNPNKLKTVHSYTHLPDSARSTVSPIDNTGSLFIFPEVHVHQPIGGNGVQCRDKEMNENKKKNTQLNPETEQKLRRRATETLLLRPPENSLDIRKPKARTKSMERQDKENTSLDNGKTKRTVSKPTETKRCLKQLSIRARTSAPLLEIGENSSRVSKEAKRRSKELPGQPIKTLLPHNQRWKQAQDKMMVKQTEERKRSSNEINN